MDDSSSSSDIPEDERNEEGWEDLEDDTEAITVVSLFDNKTFPSAKEMLLHCKDSHDFDIWTIRSGMGLEFIDLIKLVNYIRSEVQKGNSKPDTSSTSNFADDKYLKPVLEDDALLYSLDDVFEDSEAESGPQDEVVQLREQLAKLSTQFQAYREEVQRNLLEDLESSKSVPEPSSAAKEPAKLSSVDHSYFDSYSYNSIHELMIKDSVRTDTYRDFIYDNKHLFAGKTVLDVGCGTGILSMFCARAGAAKVIAVDNSDIINKARENIFRNKLDDRITCVRGKIEEVVLPVSSVDIIVSEWMGYCLLYESMLDSVLFARDKYLTPGGLMVPSHAAIKLAPLGDSDLRESHIDFWRDVYGFDMTAMLEKAHEEVLIRTLEAKELGADAATILELDLHTATVADLSFTTSFATNWKEGHELLEGFVIWFDTPFAPDSKTKTINNTWLNLSTSPEGTPTHWQQGVLLIDQPKDKFEAGQELKGSVSFGKKPDSRGLDIKVQWASKGTQVWTLE
jgi:type I protein arginine methyltransferase